MAAKWEMETRLSSESARHLFLRALRFHPECPKLYQEVSSCFSSVTAYLFSRSSQFSMFPKSVWDSWRKLFFHQQENVKNIKKTNPKFLPNVLLSSART